jgi:DNA end-binding protein Ku
MNRYGIGQIVMSEREQLVAIRSQDDLLLMSLLHHETAFRAIDDFAPARHKIDAKKMKLAQTLIETSTERHFTPARFEDRYQEGLDRLIGAKIKGEQIVAPDEEPEPEVINLMDALRKSVAQTRGHGAHRSASHKAPRSTAKRTKRASARGRKTG